MQKSVTVIGGGIAGLSASVFLAKEGFTVSLYEASPKLGGRTYSFYDKQFGGTIDNGQHILASWYSNTFDYLKIIGTYDKLYFQKQLEVNFTNSNAENFTLRASKLPPPLHLLKGLLSFKVLNASDRYAAIRMINTLKSGKLTEKELLEINVDVLFDKTSQTTRLIDSFWKPFIMAVFNSQPENTSAFMFAEIIKTGFLEKGGSNLVLPDVFLSELLVEPAVIYLQNHNCSINTNKKIEKININDNILTSLYTEDKAEIKSDFYISAVEYFNVKKLINGYNILSEKDGLSPSPIVNIHLKFDKDITSVIKKRFYGIFNTKIQWVFRVNSDQVCVVISSAKDIAEMDKNDIILLCKTELFESFPELKNINITGERVIKEMRATFVPDKESLNKRPGNRTKFDNFYLAGDWTNTGLPATIEGAVKSARSCVNLILSEEKNLNNIRL